MVGNSRISIPPPSIRKRNKYRGLCRFVAFYLQRNEKKTELYVWAENNIRDLGVPYLLDMATKADNSRYNAINRQLFLSGLQDNKTETKLSNYQM